MTLVNDVFAEYEKGGFSDPILVAAGTYTVELKAKARKSKTGDGGIFVEGTITEGPEAGKYVSVFAIWYSKDKGGGDIATKNLTAIGIDKAQLNTLVTSLGVTPDDQRFTEALAPAIDGRVVVVELEVDTYDPAKPKNRMAIGKATYKGGGTAPGAGTAAAIPQVAAAPVAAVVPAPAAAPVAAVAAPAVLPTAPVVAAPPVAMVAETAPAPAAVPVAAPVAPVAVAAPVAPTEAEPF